MARIGSIPSGRVTVSHLVMIHHLTLYHYIYHQPCSSLVDPCNLTDRRSGWLMLRAREMLRLTTLSHQFVIMNQRWRYRPSANVNHLGLDQGYTLMWKTTTTNRKTMENSSKPVLVLPMQSCGPQAIPVLLGRRFTCELT